MARNLIASIDIGTKFIRVGVADGLIEGSRLLPKMVSFGIAETSGIRNGYITEKDEVVKSVNEALRKAEKGIGMKIKNTSISVGSTGLGSVVYSSEIAVSRADLEVTELDIEKLIRICENNIPHQQTLNRKILHTIPISYRLDGNPVIGSPVGTKGSKLEMKCLFVTIQEKHLNELIEILEECGVDVVEAVASPIASSLVLLSKQQKKAGCILANIGAETVSVVVYENNTPVSLEVFPTGSNNVTNDIALGLKVSLEEAEHIKLGGITTSTYPRKRLEEIIDARLSDIFDMIEAHLKKIGRNGLLPAGIIFTGGGSGIKNLEELAKEYLKLPAKIGVINYDDNARSKNTIKDSAWSSIYGLCLLGLSADQGENYISDITKKTGQKIAKFLRRLMP